MSTKLKALSNKNAVSMQFGEWFDKVNGNTYYDVDVNIDGESFQVPYQYGYNSGDYQSIVEALAHCGYKLRVNNKDKCVPCGQVAVFKATKLKRELFKGEKS